MACVNNREGVVVSGEDAEFSFRDVPAEFYSAVCTLALTNAGNCVEAGLFVAELRVEDINGIIFVRFLNQRIP